MTLLILILFFLLVSFAYAASQGAPWVPTWKKDVKRIIRLADLKPGETFMELGCGTGGVSRAIAMEGNVRVVGVELSVLQFVIAWMLGKLSRLNNLTIKFGNAFARDLSNVNVVYMFLMPETYKKIRPKLEAELKPGSRVITYVWPIPGWEPSIVDEVDGSQKIYLYRK